MPSSLPTARPWRPAATTRSIRLWDAGDGRPLRTLAGHNGAVYDVAFSPDGRFLVSASADDTCKVWRVEDGMRMDTLPQPLKEEYCCAFSPDGRTIVAGGRRQHDPRLGVRLARQAADQPDGPGAVSPTRARSCGWRSPRTARDSSRTAEDRTVKVWETAGYTELRSWDRQPDVATGVAFSGDGPSFRVGRMDGSTERLHPPGRSSDGATATPAEPVAAARPDARPRQARAASTEREPNDAAAQANAVDAPAEITGTIAGRTAGGADVDLFRFSARAGEPWVIEVDAARSGSKLDSFVEVLDAQGRRIERVRLQAVRDSYFAFRGKDDSTVNDFRLFNWEEMQLNEYLYANGEVVKLWLYPRGPDSGFVVYPGQGTRWGYFDTTPLSHALGEPCYVVQPHPPGTT